MIPFHFLHIPKSPFFGSFTRYPFFHYVGTFSCSQIFKNRWCNIYVVNVWSAFRASGGIPSGPDIFPSFNIFSALLISAFKGGFVLTLNTIFAIGMSGLSAGGSLLRITLKCSSHLDLCPASLFMVLPSLSFTGFDRFFLFPLVFLLYHRVSSCLFCALSFQLMLLGHLCSFVCLFLHSS